jgi:FHS family glucose/mannose:H+ symporter-like MFS transporter
MLAALTGAMLPAWGYHLRSDLSMVGHHFLAVMVGVALSMALVPQILKWKSVPFVLTAACAMASLSIVFLAFSAPPYGEMRRVVGLFGAGFSMGTLNGGICQVISPACRHDLASMVNLAGILFGLGCLLVTLLAGSLLDGYSVMGILLVIAIIPVLYTLLFARAQFPPIAVSAPPPLRELLADGKSPRALLMAALLFFQFGNEWSVAGWLSVFLIHRLGISPESALALLSLYWIALLTGRVAAMAILPRVPHTRLLTGSAAAAVFGCIILLSTNNQFGATTGVLLAGLGFSTIFPLTAEKIGHRFTYYHPGIFSGIFSFAMVGAMIAPALGGYLAESIGVGVTMALPMVGTMMVFLLSIAIWLEARINE